MKTLYFKLSEKTGFEPDFMIKLNKLFSELKSDSYVLEIKKEKSARSISQNKLMWLWFNCIESETGTPAQDVHDYYVSLFLRKVIEINGKYESVISGTSKLDTKEFTDFLNKIQADASSEFGIILPLPEDLQFVEFMQKYR